MSESAYTARVTATEANFSFLLPTRKQWKWYQPKTPDNYLEYGWIVHIENDGKPYDFGFYLFKFPGSKPAQGDIQSLLKAGQKSVFVSTPLEQSYVPDMPVKTIVRGQRLIIRVDDPATLRALFSGHPAKALLRVGISGQSSVVHELPITYS